MFKLLKLALKQVFRHKVRNLLTILGIATGMFLFTMVETMRSAMHDSTRASAKDNRLIVYRKDRYCPFTSKLPDYYLERLKRVKGVAFAAPIKVLVNHCGTSLDVITLRGVRPDDIDEFSRQFKLKAGSLDAWRARSDAALVGTVLANRRRLKVGDRFESSGTDLTVAGIMESTNHQLQNAALVHLSYLQLASKDGLGIVTQYTVQTDNPDITNQVAKAIDQEFLNDTEPTFTRSEKNFLAQTARELIRLINFTRWIGIAATLAVLALIANTISMAVRGRTKEIAILQTVGFVWQEIAFLVLAEGAILGFIGGMLAVVGAVATLYYGQFSISGDGLTIVFSADWQALLISLGIAMAIGLLAAIMPAFRSSRQHIIESLHMN